MDNKNNILNKLERKKRIISGEVVGGLFVGDLI